jgi:glycosyltransferase involved in cell wall biosynthesis
MILHVGSSAPRKRLDVLYRAMSLISERMPGARLVRVGAGGWPAEMAGARVLPFLDRSTLAGVYRAADLVLLPSDREGFGLPLLEAMACGTPVVASDLPVLREVGGSVPRYARAGDAEGFARAALEVLGGTPDRVSGPARAADFSMSRFRAQLEDAYRSVAR